MVVLDTLLQKCPEDGVEEICMGMAHRGRLNVLANFLKKSLQVIFTEFSENYIPELVAGDGDVKYHLGYRTVRKLAEGAEVEIRLSANPSHLEAVDPVVEGTARARQRIRGDTEHRRKVLPLLLHGDAAFAGQGIVAEMALDFRQEFGRDFVIDMYCYRKYGHNEGDEPSFTQPDLYERIEKRPSAATLYKRELLKSGVLSADDLASLETEFELRLEMTLDEVRAIEKAKADEKAK